jgi:hypothetical protein
VGEDEAQAFRWLVYVLKMGGDGILLLVCAEWGEARKLLAFHVFAH